MKLGTQISPNILRAVTTPSLLLAQPQALLLCPAPVTPWGPPPQVFAAPPLSLASGEWTKEVTKHRFTLQSTMLAPFLPSLAEDLVVSDHLGW